MRVHTFLSVLVLATGVLASSPASAELHHGAECNPDPGAAGVIGYNRAGPFNLSASAQVVHCGGSRGSNAFWGNVVVTVHDRSVAENVGCFINLTDAAGNLFFVAFRSTSSFGGAAQPPLIAAVPGITAFIYLECSLPGQTANGVSHLTTYETP